MVADSGFEQFMQLRKEASDEFVNGNVEPLERISAHNSPATLFGPKGDCIQGADEVNAANAKGSGMFKPGARNEFEIMHRGASGDLAYWTGIQRSTVNMSGKEPAVQMDLRVTEIFRKDDGQWRLIHRHADKLSMA